MGLSRRDRKGIMESYRIQGRRQRRASFGHYVAGFFRDGPEAPMLEVFEFCESEQEAESLVQSLSEDDRFSALGHGYFPEEGSES